MRPGDLDTGDRLATIEDVAGRLAVTAATVRAYITRGRWPAPDGHVGRTPVWRHATVEHELRKRRPPRPAGADVEFGA